MYAAQLKRKPEFQYHRNKETQLVDRYNKMQLHQLEILKMNQNKKTKAQSIALRNKTLQLRDKINYANELDRIKGYLSDTRLPMGNIERLKKREEELKKLGAEISN